MVLIKITFMTLVWLLLLRLIPWNRPQIRRLYVIQSTIEIDSLSIWDTERSEVVLIGGTFNSYVTSDIAIFSISALFSSNDPEEYACFFFRAKTLSLRLKSNLLYQLFLLIILRCFSLILRIGATIESTMVKDGECLTRAWSLSIKKRQTNQVTLGVWMFSNPYDHQYYS